MKTIYYFSGTGNTLYLAKILAERCNYKLQNIATLKDEKVTLTGDVGLLFPIYAMGIPKIVQEFLKNAEIENVNYIFSVASCGGSGYGIPFSQIDEILETKNCRLDYSEYCHMPDNYLKLFKPLSEEESKIDINSSKIKIGSIAQNIEKHAKIHAKNNSFMYPVFLGIYKFWRVGLKRAHKSFKLKDERCISCGICKDVCPVQNIELVSGKPVWDKRCEECLACANLCPTIAISCGGKSKHDARYKNPYISIDELKS
ncbi:MAG: EFR1 family ferrodoxin [Cetobacterium sp.]